MPSMFEGLYFLSHEYAPFRAMAVFRQWLTTTWLSERWRNAGTLALDLGPARPDDTLLCLLRAWCGDLNQRHLDQPASGRGQCSNLEVISANIPFATERFAEDLLSRHPGSGR